MLYSQHSSLLTSLPSLGLIAILALLGISSFTTASPVQPSKDVLLVERAPVPGSVNSNPGAPLLAANAAPAPNPAPAPGSAPAPGPARLQTIASESNFEQGQDVGPIPVCEGKAPTDRSLYPSPAIADRFIGRSLEAVCRERDPGPNCVCLLNQRTLRVELQCYVIGNFFPTIDRDWHASGVMQNCRTNCRCPQSPTDQLQPPGSPRTPLGPQPPGFGYRVRGPSLDMDTIV